MSNKAFSRRSLLAAASALAVAGSTRGTFAQRGDPALRIVSPWELTSFDPADTGFLLARLGIAETLVQVEPDGKLVGGVASGWTVGADKLTWRFPIRSGLKFHDGTAVTAANVAASLKLAFVGESLSSVPLESVAVDGDAVIIRTKTVFSVLPAFLCDYASIVLAPSAYAASGSVQKIVATGPFKIAAIEGKTGMDLERFEGHRTPSTVARVRYAGVPSGDTRANIAVAGDADLVFTIAPTAVARIDATGLMKVASLTIPRVRPMSFNAGLPQFADVRVRRAISMAIDREGIASAILRHPGSNPNQLLPPILGDWHDKSLPPLVRDVAGARKLLDEAGWIVGSDGVRAKGGVRLAANLLTMANRPELPPMATAIQAQLKQIGMDISVEAGPNPAIPAAIREGRMEMTMFARTYVNVPEVMATIIPDFTLERSTWGTLNWEGRGRIKVLTDEYVTTFDEARKAQIRTQVMKIIREEAPTIPVSWFEHTVAISSRVRNVTIDPYEMRYYAERVQWI